MWNKFALAEMKKRKHTKTTLEQVFDCLPQAIIVTDGKSLISFMNSSAENMTGWTRKTAIGENLAEVINLLDSRTEKEIKIASLHTGNKPVSSWNVLLRRPLKNDLTVNIISVPVPGIHKTNGFIAILEDVSERTNADLDHLNRQKMEAIAHMAGGLAHDFTNSLGVISGHASSIADTLIPKTRAHEEALRILEAVKRAGNATKHLMSIARIGGSKADLKVEAVHLGNIVKDAINIMEESFAQQKMSFKIRNPESMPYIMADDRQMLDCLVSLLINATDAMPDGGTVTIDAKETNYRKTCYIALRIKDNGKGMTPEVLRHAVEPFFTTNTPNAGAGLGLTVVMSSLECWGGFIKIHSKPDHGTSVILFLRKAKIQPTKEAIRDSATGRETILIIDDTKALLEKNAQILKNTGYKVYTASNARQGLETYRKNVDNIDLTIIDLVMPGISGKKVLEEILTFNPTAAIIMTSGFSRDYVRMTLERGAWGFLQKPFSPEHLLSIVRKTFEQNSIPKTDTFAT